MYGAIAGDIAGSLYEFGYIKTKNFDFWADGTRFTDDTAMTVAVASALLETVCKGKSNEFKAVLIKEMQKFGRKYPDAGYGKMFYGWLHSDNPMPYNSYGNGSAMRVSPCGFIAESLEQALELAKQSAEVTHNHPEGIKGAQAVSACIYLAKIGKSKEEIKEYVENNFYKLDFTLDEIRPGYVFDVTCQGSVPQSIEAFLESANYEDAVRNAVSLGGDCDTMGAITGSIAEAFYGMDEKIKNTALSYLGMDMIKVVTEFEDYIDKRKSL